MNFKFNFKDWAALDNDLEASKKVIPAIVQKVIRAQLGLLRTEQRSLIPRKSGKLQRSFGFSVRRAQGKVIARFGFLVGKNVSASTAIAANVLQAGGASPRKGKYLWIPLPANRNSDGSAQTKPGALIDSGGFVQMSKAGNKIAFRPDGIPAFVLKTFVKLSRPPVPIEERVERAVPEITGEIEETIKQVIEAKRTVQGIE